ncbi:MAG: YerC/YecD family TrpR-related protein [Proteobacteria bacterium]|nr:YerC/YecD family TrpR-related protein [Pseudomonadota bacterium]MDA0994219.1 YerC/YecD family TrpR-related protein [Pseudomonadota bacterium]
MKPNRNDSGAYRKRTEDSLFRAIMALRDIHECRIFFKDLCSPAELQALVDRWKVVELLKDNISYRRINEITGVSVTTIGRVARCLVDGCGGYALALENSVSSHHGQKPGNS